nr:serine/threonine-protein kinase [Bifidobacterium gallicum]
MSEWHALNLEPGNEVGGYELISRLGSGAMGSVWKVEDGGGNAYAMKILLDSLNDDQPLADDPDGRERITARERLRREAMALRRIHDPGVCSIVDMELDDSLAFIVTDLIDGRNLRDDVKVNGPYVGHDLERLASRLIAAVQAVHDADIVHRDIKPTNIMVSMAGPVLVDFGIAMGQGESHVTRTGLVMGTPGFIAPEILEGAESDALTDWWSLASVLAFAATGRPVFGVTPMDVVLAREAAGNADLAGLPPRTVAAFRAALHPDRSRRIGPEELLAAITADAWLSDDGDGEGVMLPFEAGADGTNPRTCWAGTKPGMRGARSVASAPPAPPQESSINASAPRRVAGMATPTRVMPAARQADRQTRVMAPTGVTAQPGETAWTQVMRAPLTAPWQQTAGEPTRRRVEPTHDGATAIMPAVVPGTATPPAARQAGAETTVMANGPADAMLPGFEPVQPHSIADRSARTDGDVGAANGFAGMQYGGNNAGNTGSMGNASTADGADGEDGEDGAAIMRGLPLGSPEQLEAEQVARLQRGAWWPLAAIALVTGVLAASHPALAGAAGSLMLWLLAAYGLNTRKQIQRQARHGGLRRGTDVLRRLATYPWHLVHALLFAVPASLLFVAVAAVVGIAGCWALQLPLTMTPLNGWPAVTLPLPAEAPLSLSGLVLGAAGGIGWFVGAAVGGGKLVRLAAGTMASHTVWNVPQRHAGMAWHTRILLGVWIVLLALASLWLATSNPIDWAPLGAALQWNQW